MSDSTIYRASTTAPVNIAVIKYVYGPLSLCAELTMTRQVLGKARSALEPADQLLAVRHPLAGRPESPHDGVLLIRLSVARHAHPQRAAPGHRAQPHVQMHIGPSPTTPRARRGRPLRATAVTAPSAARVVQQLPHRRRSGQLCRRLRRARPGHRPALPAARHADGTVADRAPGQRVRMSQSVWRLRCLAHGPAG